MATRAALTLIACTVVLAGFALVQPERAAADYNLSGEWTFDFGGGPNCPTTITQSYWKPSLDFISITTNCNLLKFNGTIDKSTGSFTATYGVPPAAQLTGSLDASGHVISGVWYVNTQPVTSGSFVGTGGNGDPKPAAPTATPCPGTCPTPTTAATQTATPSSTPPPVGGAAFDTPAKGSAFHAWWLASIAAAALVAWGGAAYAWRRG